MTYKDEILERENVIFALVWAVISVFVSQWIVQGLELLQDVISFVITFPNWLPNVLEVTSTPITLILAIGVALLLAPFVRILWEKLVHLVRR